MGLVSKVLDFRLDIDAEFQGWILIFATLQVAFNFLLPCYCAGSSWTPARRCASWLMLRLPMFYVFMVAFNGLFMFLIITWLPDWGYADYVKAFMKFGLTSLKQLLKSIDAIVIILAAAFVIAFKDRIALVLGLDHKQLFRCKVRDCLTCWSSSRYKAIELVIWKVEDLSAGDLFNANNVYAEVWLGYNEEMKTRVHNNAGSACIMKETIQLNYDEDDEDDQLMLLIQNQKMVGNGELARLMLDADALKKTFKECAAKVPPNQMPKWDESQFLRMDLNPRGSIWLRISEVDEEVYTHGNLVQDLTTC